MNYDWVPAVLLLALIIGAFVGVGAWANYVIGEHYKEMARIRKDHHEKMMKIIRNDGRR